MRESREGLGPRLTGASLVPRPRPSTRERGSGNFIGIFVRFKSCDAYLCACAFQQRARDRETAVPRGGVWVAVTRDFERDICVGSEILQSDWTLPNRAPVPGKSTKVPRPSFVRESREGLGPRLNGRNAIFWTAVYSDLRLALCSFYVK